MTDIPCGILCINKPQNFTSFDVIAKLRANNVKVPAGRIRGNGREVNLTFDGEFKSFEDIAALEIGKHQGKRVYMRDIATTKLIAREARSRSFVINSSS